VTAIPVLVPPASGQTWRPWLTPAMFTAYPHWLDLDNLIPGGVANVQTDVLADVLLAATDWAVGELGEMRLDGHLVSGETQTARVLPDGRVTLMPRDVPVRAIVSLSAGWDPANLSALPLPDPTMRFSAGGRVVKFRPPASLCRGRGREIFFESSYVAGFPSALLSPVAKGDMSVTVDDPAGILPGDVLRVYDPGTSEDWTVAGSYVPQVPTIPATATSISLASATAEAHVGGTGVTGFPREALQAVIAYGVAQLMRDDVSEEEPASPFGPAARTTSNGRGGLGGGLINDAYGWLAPYRQYVRRG
jgi:hypothetical protein